MRAIERVELERVALHERLDSAKTQAERNRLGQFATPPALAREIVAHALSLLQRKSKVRFLEPGFGSGSFYSALLRLLPPSRIEAAVGYEIDPHYAEPAADLWKGSRLQLRPGDFTTAEPPSRESERFNCVVCNPPYVRHHHLSQEQKGYLQAAVASHVGIRTNGLGGLYTYFLLLSKAWMQNDGVGAWLIPSEFMDVNYGRQVKEFLLKTVTLLRVHRFDPNEVQFGDALVSSAVLFLRNEPPPPNHRVEFSFGGSLGVPTVSDSISVEELRDIAKWSGLPMRGRRHAPLTRGETLGDFFAIKRGIATGCNQFFILTPGKAAEWNLPDKFLIPILPSPRDLEADEIPADRHGNPKIAKRLFLLACDLPEQEVRREYPALWKYIQSGIAKGVHGRYLSRHREPWYAQEKREPAPFLCTYMGRATSRSGVPFRFILNHSRATAANVYLLLYPKPCIEHLLRASPDLAGVVWHALCSITAEMLTGQGRIYGGGLHKLEPKELANVDAEPLSRILRDAAGFSMQRQLNLFRRTKAS